MDVVISWVYLLGIFPAWCIAARASARYWVEECPLTYGEPGDLAGDIWLGAVIALIWPIAAPVSLVYLFVRNGIEEGS